MKNKIRNIEDLKTEKRLLKLEMAATEKLIVESFHVSKENLMQSATGSFFSMMKKEPIGVSDVVQIFSGQNYLKWWQKIIPVMPLVLKIAGKLYKRKKRKKDKERQLQSGELTLRRVAS